MPNPVIGSVPRGEDLFGRDSLVADLWERLEQDNILLVAPRRFGKTGIMYKLLDKPRKAFKPIYINVEHILTAGDFMVELLAVLLRDRHFTRIGHTLWAETKEFGQFIRNIPSSIDIGGVKVELREKTDVPTHWISYGERALALLAKEEPRLLLLLDEFAVMIDHIAKQNTTEAEQLLRWFRVARTAPGTQTRFVIGGSINLISTLNGMKLVDTVNDLSIIRLRPFDTETATRFIEVIFESRQIELSPAVKETILNLVGAPIPYLLSVLLVAILDRQRSKKGKVTADMVKAAFNEDLLGGATSVVFHHYRSRIDQHYLGTEGQSAKAILGILSKADSPVRQDTLYQIFLRHSNSVPSPATHEGFLNLMSKLDNDFYISTQDGTYDFFSRVLKLWWKTHYGFQGE